MNILFYFVIILILILIFKYYKDNEVEGFLNFTQCKKLHVAQRLTDIFKENDIKRDDKDWDLYLPCGYTYIESELREMSPLKKNQKIFGLDGCDKIVSKYFIWKTLVNKLGGHYTNYFPKTYSCSSDGITDLLKNHVDGNKYIAKKDVQRQTGLKIINNITEIKDVVKDKKFLVIQELLKNPFLIDNRKINIRVYFLIVCETGKVSAYIHENGFIYYTRKYFDYDSTNDDCHITTGYIDRSVYEKNPLTIDDLYKYLKKRGYNPDVLRNNYINLFKKIINALEVPLCNSDKLKKGLAFQLFGCDIAPDNELNVKLIELNKGPDLGAKSKRDNEVKHEVSMDLFEIVNIVNKQHKENRFIKIK